jgi:hypothetical protein
MPAVRRICRSILPAITIAGATVTASAQSGEIQLAANGAGLRLETQSMHASHVYVDDDARPAPAPVTLPRNMNPSPELEQKMLGMLRISPTFRRQCTRLGQTSALTVTIRRAIPAGRGTALASTQIINVAEGRVYATVHLGPAADDGELLAHEFEHIIEQLDGVDLAAMARRRDTGVRLIGESGVFETDRARSVGRQVAEELRRFAE